uniref:Uncharacterized protein n=1 Tax=Hucho hucho TaxID=62062 RepID=A0A4W5KCA6_9TELE
MAVSQCQVNITHFDFILSSCFSADWSIEALLHKWNLKCVNITLEKFRNKDQLAGSTLPGSHTVQMLRQGKLNE